MKKIYLLTYLLLTACANKALIVSGNLKANDTTIDLKNYNVILDKNCTPTKIDMHLQSCSNINTPKESLCIVDKNIIISVIQVLDDDALVRFSDPYGGQQIAFIKNLAKATDGLTDGAIFSDLRLLKKEPYTYITALGTRHTVPSFEFITISIPQLTFKVEDGKCSKNNYTFTYDNKTGWKEK